MPAGVVHPKSQPLTKNMLRDVCYVPQAFAQNTSMLIRFSTVLYISLSGRKSYAILVQSEAIAYLLREFFKLVWYTLAVPRYKVNSLYFLQTLVSGWTRARHPCLLRILATGRVYLASLRASQPQDHVSCHARCTELSLR